MFVGDFSKCAQQPSNILHVDQRLKFASARAQLGDVLTFDLFATRAAQILQRVRHDFAL